MGVSYFMLVAHPVWEPGQFIELANKHWYRLLREEEKAGEHDYTQFGVAQMCLDDARHGRGLVRGSYGEAFSWATKINKFHVDEFIECMKPFWQEAFDTKIFRGGARMFTRNDKEWEEGECSWSSCVMVFSQVEQTMECNRIAKIFQVKYGELVVEALGDTGVCFEDEG